MMKLLGGTVHVKHVGKCRCLHSKNVHLETWQTNEKRRGTSHMKCYIVQRLIVKVCCVPLDEAGSSLQSVLHRQQSGLQGRRRGHAGVLGSVAALPADPPPASGCQGGVRRLRAHRARLQQVRAVHDAATAAPLVCCEEATQTLFQLLALFLGRLLAQQETIITHVLQTFCLSFCKSDSYDQ